MPQIPRDTSPDSTLALLSEGYTFVSRRCRHLRSDIFETRLMLQRAVCILGEEAARVFYEQDRFTRRGALPLPTLLLLQDKGSVATMDGEAHRQRKRMFMSLMTPDSIQRLVDAAEAQWRARIGQWERMGQIVLLPELEEILCSAVYQWAGIPLVAVEATERTRQLAAMIDGAGAVGPRMWRGMLLRARAERWVRSVVAKLRAGELEVPSGSPVDVIARHRNLDDQVLNTKIAAVEVINLLRPTVAVARFIVFAALAMHEHRECRQGLQSGGEAYADLFVQEVRRFYPFFPLVAGRVLKEFDWRSYRFTKGTWVLLDLYGTNHDERIWEKPDIFQPERFRRWSGTAYGFIPQGGGDYYTGHRCAGEWATIALMKGAVRLLTTAMRYDVPEQDLRIDLSRMPAMPRSGFVIRNVERLL